MDTELAAAHRTGFKRCHNLDDLPSCEAHCTQVAVFSILSAFLADRCAPAAGWLWLAVWWTGSCWFGFPWTSLGWVAAGALPIVQLRWSLLIPRWLQKVSMECLAMDINEIDVLLLKIVRTVVTQNGHARRC